MGADVFDRPETWRKLAPKLGEGWALDAICSAETPPADAALLDAAALFLAAAAAAQAQGYPSAGLGTDHRLEAEAVRGFALEHQGAVLHLAAFAPAG